MKELKAIIDAHFLAMERGDLIAALRESRIAFGEVNDVADLSEHPALKRIEVDTAGGHVSMVSPPASIVGEDYALRPVPALGEHSEAIRAEFG